MGVVCRTFCPVNKKYQIQTIVTTGFKIPGSPLQDGIVLIFPQSHWLADNLGPDHGLPQAGPTAIWVKGRRRHLI
jgi:hypothetical protein